MTEQSLVASEDDIQFCHGLLADPYPFFHRLMAEDPVHWSELLDVWDVLQSLKKRKPDTRRTEGKL